MMQPAFLDELVVKPETVSGDWRLVDPFSYRTLVFGPPMVIEVPVGFVTDFASIPRPLRVIYESWGAYGKAAVVHDYMCAMNAAYSRKSADDVFLEGMAISGVPSIRRQVMYRAVQLWGMIRYGTNYNRILG